jgi:type-F conjugative transfer system pilin assembly protein TrbC
VKEVAQNSHKAPNQNDQDASKSRLAVFISLSMPVESVKALIRDAKTFNAIVVLRGLKNNSFRETLNAVQEWGDVDTGLISIDPELFKRHKIDRVPVFVWMDTNQEKARLSGNVTLAFAHATLKAAL